MDSQRTPLAHTTLDVAGSPFHAIWTPEDGVLRAGGFDAEVGHDARAHGLDSLLTRLRSLDPAYARRGLAEDPTDHGSIPDALRAYAAGDFAAVDELPVGQPETPFRGEVWRALRDVPAGRTVTYTELSALAGRPSAVRAAASACANNLVALVVPCHRIVRRDGGLGGFMYGVAVKERLLALEGSIAAPLL